MQNLSNTEKTFWDGKNSILCLLREGCDLQDVFLQRKSLGKTIPTIGGTCTVPGNWCRREELRWRWLTSACFLFMSLTTVRLAQSQYFPAFFQHSPATRGFPFIYTTTVDVKQQLRINLAYNINQKADTIMSPKVIFYNTYLNLWKFHISPLKRQGC